MSAIDTLIDELGYRNADGFLDTETKWSQAIEHAHSFRHTNTACAAIRCTFRGVYTLGIQRNRQKRTTTPVVYVCEAPDEAQADQIHRLVWNQGIAPFLLVVTPKGVRLYSGFDYATTNRNRDAGEQRGVLDAAIAFNEITRKLGAFSAASINDGRIWGEWGTRIDPTRRVDHRLLASLEGLAKRLHQSDTGLPREAAHALIGRSIYLRYLRDRQILTERTLVRWGLKPAEVFARTVSRANFYALQKLVDDWMNGSIFPIEDSVRMEHIRDVMGALNGDEDKQLHLDFQAYDFSHIPIELLSSIYEQFVANEGRDRESGAYYTPLPLVNFVLNELDEILPLKPGMRVFDPSCGSGAFLVQCYQLLIEKERQAKKSDLSPTELRRLLVDHIFGLDVDPAACRVTEFSLCLALLDQIPAATLAKSARFKLPSLRGSNIFEGDFFDDQVSAHAVLSGFDWIVGNPPWFKANAHQSDQRKALRWMKVNEKSHPVAGQQVAQAFAWKALASLNEQRGSAMALVLPAMTLFEEQSTFRTTFFKTANVSAVANLANLRRDLFGDRTEQPAMVLFCEQQHASPNSDVVVYSPFVINQVANRGRSTWTLTVDHSEVRFVDRNTIEGGESLPWKTAMWGGHRDLRLLRSVAKRHRTIESLENARTVTIRQGPQIAASKRGDDAYQFEKDLVGQPALDVKLLRQGVHVHAVPTESVKFIGQDEAWLRKDGGRLGLEVNFPPHVIVSAARTFAVFSDQFLVVPARQIGIGGDKKHTDLLKALALYLSSSFARYHQFLLSPQEGIRGGRSTLETLRKIPVPFADASGSKLQEWVRLHTEIVELSKPYLELKAAVPTTPKAWVGIEKNLVDLESQIDNLTYEALGLNEHDRWLIDDFVKVKMDLVDGKVGERAAGIPPGEELQSYATALRDLLDDYLHRGSEFQHKVLVVHEPQSGMVQIEFQRSKRPHPPRVVDAKESVAAELRTMRDAIERRDSQWLYFARNLVVYDNERVFIAKPMQRLFWTRSQALADADQIIADLVGAGARG